jgi:hypothetical protein
VREREKEKDGTREK